MKMDIRRFQPLFNPFPHPPGRPQKVRPMMRLTPVLSGLYTDPALQTKDLGPDFTWKSGPKSLSIRTFPTFDGGGEGVYSPSFFTSSL